MPGSHFESAQLLGEGLEAFPPNWRLTLQRSGAICHPPAVLGILAKVPVQLVYGYSNRIRQHAHTSCLRTPLNLSISPSVRRFKSSTAIRGYQPWEYLGPLQSWTSLWMPVATEGAVKSVQQSAPVTSEAGVTT